MAIRKISEGNDGNLIKEYIMDTASDVSSLPSAPVGSMALCVDGTVYIVAPSGEWTKFGG